MKKLFRSLFVWLLAFYARWYLKKTKPLLIGVTWSVWKTSCRLIISDVLKKLLPQEYIYTSPKNYNSDLGLSLSILWIESYKPSIDGVLNALFEGMGKAFFSNKSPTIIVLEYWIDAPGDMDVLLSIAVPDFAVFTALDFVHAEQFPDGIVGINNEKLKLINACKDAVFINTAIDASTIDFSTKTKFLFSELEWEWDISFSNYVVNISGDKIVSSFLYMINDQSLTITSNINWKYNISYAVIGLTIADILAHRKSYPNIWSMQALSLNVELQPWRFTLLTGKYNDIIVDSTYNASPESMRKVITETVYLREHFFSDYTLICILGEMREIWEQSKDIHIELAKWISDKIDNLIWVSWNSVYMTDYLIGLQDPDKHIFRTQTNLEVSDIVRQIKQINWEDKKYMILFKSSQWEIWLEESIKPFIKVEQYSLLARQELYWLQKKQFVKKLYVSKD